MSMNEGLLLIAVGVVVAVLLRFLAARRSAVKQEGREALDQRVADEAERQAAEAAARREAERQAAEAAARREAERQAERQAAEAAARREVERRAVEEAARLEAERRSVEEAQRLEDEERQAVEAAIAEESARQATEEAQRRQAAAVAKIKTPEQTVVMVADDSRVVRVKTGRLLAAHRYQVLMAEDGQDAGRQIEKAVPDVLVTDVDMPGMDGLELARQVRGNPRTAHLPIIMVTSDSDELRIQARAAGVNVVLGKPYPEEQLIAHIQQLLGNSPRA